VAVRATAEPVALAAWLVGELDKPVNGQGTAQERTARHEYRPSNGADSLVRVFYLASSLSPQGHQAVGSRVRALAGIPQVFVYSALGALAVRGTAEQVAAAERVIGEMKAQ
jgi:hypothetical protein